MIIIKVKVKDGTRMELPRDKDIICRPEFPPRGCNGIFPPKPPTPKKVKQVVTDEVCGNIEQNCTQGYVEYWKIVGIQDLPSGTVSIVNTSDCTMTVRADTTGNGISDYTLFSIDERGQTKSVTLG